MADEKHELDMSTFKPEPTGSDEKHELDMSTFQPEEEEGKAERPGYFEEFFSGPIRALQSTYQGIVDLPKARTTAEQALPSTVGPIGNAVLAVHHLANDTLTALNEGAKARHEAQRQGEGIPGQILATAEQYPFIGGMVQHAEKGGTEMFSPESIGATTEGAMYYALPKVIEGVGKLGGAVTKPLRGSLVEKGSKILGTSPQYTTEPLLEKASIQEKLYQQRQAEAAQEAEAKKIKATDKAFKEAGEAKVKHEQEVKAHEQKVFDEREMAFAKDAAAKQEHAAQVKEVEERNQAAKEFNTQRSQMANDINAGSGDFGEKVVTETNKARTVDNKNYAEVRKKISNNNDPGVSATDIAPKVEAALAKNIKGSPETIRQAKDILRQAAEDANAANLGNVIMGGMEMNPAEMSPETVASLKAQGVLPEPEPTMISFDNIQGYSSELGMQIANFNFERAGADVYRAMKAVKEVIDNYKDEIAGRNGASAELEKADHYHREMMETFYDKDSAIAKVRKSVGSLDPEHYAQPVLTGKAAKTGIERLRRFSPELAKQAEDLRTKHAEYNSTKEAKTKAVPEKPAPHTIEKSTVGPAPGELKPHTIEDLPKPKPVKPPETITKEGLEKNIGQRVVAGAREAGKLSRYDVGLAVAALYGIFIKHPLFAAADLGGIVMRKSLAAELAKPEVIAKLSKLTDEHYQALNRAPEEVKARFSEDLKAAIDENIAHGRDIKVDPKLVRMFNWPKYYALPQSGRQELLERGSELITAPETE